MENKELNPGDKVYHLSDSSIVWVIESIENNEAYCSTLLKDTKELKKEKFIIVTLKKIVERDGLGVYFSSNKRSNRY